MYRVWSLSLMYVFVECWPSYVYSQGCELVGLSAYEIIIRSVRVYMHTCMIILMLGQVET